LDRASGAGDGGGDGGATFLMCYWIGAIIYMENGKNCFYFILIALFWLNLGKNMTLYSASLNII
jgi:hypothetical protein